MGMNAPLAHEYFKPPGRERRSYATGGDGEKYRERHNEYWYEAACAADASVEWADYLRFSDLSFSAQRVLLFLRAIVSKPDIVILDEAFSGLDDWIRDKCILFLEFGEGKRLTPFAKPVYNTEDKGALSVNGYESIVRGARETRDSTFFGLEAEQALVCVAHVKEEVPTGVRQWMYLPDLTSEPSRPGMAKIRCGVPARPIRYDDSIWNIIWDTTREKSRKATIERVAEKKSMKKPDGRPVGWKHPEPKKPRAPKKMKASLDLDTEMEKSAPKARKSGGGRPKEAMRLTENEKRAKERESAHVGRPTKAEAKAKESASEGDGRSD